MDSDRLDQIRCRSFGGVQISLDAQQLVAAEWMQFFLGLCALNQKRLALLLEQE